MLKRASFLGMLYLIQRTLERKMAQNWWSQNSSEFQRCAKLLFLSNAAASGLSHFRDESTTVTLSGVENYFLQGKAPQLNKGRVKRVKGKAIPHQADSQ